MRNIKTDFCECSVIHADAVEAVMQQMLSNDDTQDLCNLFKMFSDPSRLKLLWALKCREMCGCDLAALLGVTKSAVSHQLKALKLLNLVKNRKEGKVVYYSLSDDHVLSIIDQGLEHIKE